MKVIEILTPIRIEGTTYLMPLKALKLNDTYCLYNVEDYKKQGLCKDNKENWRIGYYIIKNIWFLAKDYKTKKQALEDLPYLMPKVEKALLDRKLFESVLDFIKEAKEWKK